MSGGTWGAGFIGPDGTDYVAEQADGMRQRMGRGIYSQDAHGAMGQWRDLVAIPLALVRNFLDWMVLNGNPGTAEDLLPYWEEILGLAYYADRLTIAQRQQRCKERLRRWVALPGDPPGRPDWAGFPTEQTIKGILWAIHYRALGIFPVDFSVPDPAHPHYVLEVDPAFGLPGNAYWYHEMEYMIDRLCPAWGRITIHY